MKRMSSRFLVCGLALLLAGCRLTSLTPTQLARAYVQCRWHHSPNQAQCQHFKFEFDAIDQQLQAHRGHYHLGQTIMTAQTQLVTLQQEHAKKGLDDQTQQQSIQGIITLQRNITVLYSVYLLMLAK